MNLTLVFYILQEARDITIFQKKKNFCYVDMAYILGILSIPTLKAGTTRIQYEFNKTELKNMMELN